MKYKKIEIPEWTYVFHEHKYPAMPMRLLAFLDGVMAATGCTYGKGSFDWHHCSVCHGLRHVAHLFLFQWKEMQNLGLHTRKSLILFL